MTRSSARLFSAFMVLVCLIAAGQLYVFYRAQPAPDSVEYFEVADQIARVGYAKALSLHWSPLYPLYLLAARRVTSGAIERELAVTAAADVVLLVGLCLVVGLVFSSTARGVRGWRTRGDWLSISHSASCASVSACRMRSSRA
jgi:hypothetical protein